ncbi:hypothetical protein, partial [Allopontixanthobacter sp.]|uniref:hypothetical protein n=1 Tax=Allopontixanthobacter sp. TaxID=2906452 RepID=UPI002AB9882B
CAQADRWQRTNGSNGRRLLSANVCGLSGEARNRARRRGMAIKYTVPGITDMSDEFIAEVYENWIADGKPGL